MNKKLLGGLGIVTLITTLAVAFMPKINDNLVYALSRNGSGYSCDDIVFSEIVSNPSASSDISDLSSKGVTSLNCSMTEWTNANYASNMTNSAIKIGGSSNFSGSVKLTLKEQTTNRLIVYATGWNGDSQDLKLGINGDYQSVSTTSEYEYNFTPYTFELDNKVNEIIITNNPNAAEKSRIVISKIVLRLYKETPVPPTPGEEKISTLIFKAKCGGSGIADDDGAQWTITSDAAESNFDNTKGIHYGTSKAVVSYLRLSTSSISGTIKSIVVNASGASKTSAKLNITVGGIAFGTEQSLTSTATEYTLTGSASGEIIINITQTSAQKALYCKSIIVTYE